MLNQQHVALLRPSTSPFWPQGRFERTQINTVEPQLLVNNAFCARRYILLAITAALYIVCSCYGLNRAYALLQWSSAVCNGK